MPRRLVVSAVVFLELAAWRAAAATRLLAAELLKLRNLALKKFCIILKDLNIREGTLKS